VAGAAAPGGQLCEPTLLASLVQLLGQRERHSLLLSDLGALLPGSLRHGVKERGGLRSWLQRYPELFLVSGQPGKESVTLRVGDTTPPESAHSEPNRAALPPRPAIPNDGDGGGALGVENRDRQDDEQSAVQLRGLPYRATVADIKRFLGRHAKNLKDESAVQLVINRDGRPSGFARVQFSGPAAAKAARDELHMHIMETAQPTQPALAVAGAGQTSTQDRGERYVEIFLFSERPNKLRFKKATATCDVGDASQDDADASGVTKEQVVAECREHMSTPGKGRLLLSMLGVALSVGARAYLKKTDQGLKHFLSQYPQEFSVDGAKGRECIGYLPAIAKGMENNSDLPVDFSEAQKSRRRGPDGTGGPSTGSIAEIPWALRSPELPVPESPLFVPNTGSPGPPGGVLTPSDWGTPQPLAFDYDPRQVTRPHVPRSAVEAARAEAAAQQISGAAGLPGNFGAAAAAAVAAQHSANWSNWSLPPPTGYFPDNMHWSGLAGMPPWEPQLPGDDTAAVNLQSQQPLWAQDPYGLNAALFAMPADLSSVGLGIPTNPPGNLSVPSAADVSATLKGIGSQQQDANSSCALRLRGLPANASEQDVFSFFSKHEVVLTIADDPKAVRMIGNSNGVSTRQAIVDMRSREAAETAQTMLNGQLIGKNCIDVWIDRASTAIRMAAVPGDGSDGLTGGTGAACPSTAGAIATTPDLNVSTGLDQSQVSAQRRPPAIIESSPASSSEPLGSCFDGAGDTGGSGEPAITANDLANGDAGCAGGGGASRPAPSAAAPLAAAPTGATGQDETSWEALFDFLKRDDNDGDDVQGARPNMPPPGLAPSPPPPTGCEAAATTRPASDETQGQLQKSRRDRR